MSLNIILEATKSKLNLDLKEIRGNKFSYIDQNYSYSYNSWRVVF